MAENLNRIRIRRGTNAKIAASTERQASGQPIYNEDKGYLSIGKIASDANASSDKYYESKGVPLRARTVLGYADEENIAKNTFTLSDNYTSDPLYVLSGNSSATYLASSNPIYLYDSIKADSSNGYYNAGHNVLKISYDSSKGSTVDWNDYKHNIAGDTTINGATSLNSTLDVAGKTTLSNELKVTNDATFDTSITVVKSITTTSDDAAHKLTGTLEVTGNTTLDSQLKSKSITQLATDSYATIGTPTSALDSTGDLTVAGDTSIEKTLAVSSTAIIGDKLTISSGGADITGAFTTSSTNSLGGETTVTGNVLPSTTSTYSLGSNSLKWKDLYLSGSINSSSAYVTSITCNYLYINATN